ncbi:MAG: siderophore-interacting protein [Actinomycetota bacterium]
MTTDFYDELDMVVDHLNEEHDDTVLFVLRHVAATEHDVRDVRDARLTRVTADGIGGAVTTASGDRVDVLSPFVETPSSIDDVRMHLFGLLTAARAVAPDEQPLTSLEAELTGASGITTSLAHVVRTTVIAPNLREITFGGLGDFVSLGGDEFLYVLAPPEGREELTVGTDFTWLAYEEMPDEDKPIGAYYTVRRWRPDEGEIDMWFVLHEHAGPASRWASAASPGDPVALWGPRRSAEPPPDVRRYLFVTDESGLGATASLLDQVASSDAPAPVHVIAEAIDESHVVELPMRDGVTVEWILRGDRAPGEGTAFLDAVRALDLDPAGLYAFGAAESRQITAVRKHLRHHVGLAADHVSMTGYWRR